MEDAVALLAQPGSCTHADVEAGAQALPRTDDVIEATRAACLEDEVLKYVAGEGAKRFNLLSLVSKPG